MHDKGGLAILMKFDWSHGNDTKCAKRVSIKEIEQLFHCDPTIIRDVVHSENEERFVAIGTVSNRQIHVVFTERFIGGESHIRPISARYMHKKEAKRHGKAIP
jgi:uncharacterized DUF497 family protein